MIRMRPDGTFEFDTVEEALAFQEKRSAEIAGPSAAATVAIVPQPASAPPGTAGDRWPAHRRPGRPFSGGSVKEMPGGKFRWVFRFKGREYDGPVVEDRAVAEAQRLEAVDGILRGELPPIRRAGTVQANGNGYRWKIERDFRRYLGPTVDTEEEAERGRAAAVAALDRGEQPATAPKYRSRSQREAARSVAPRNENIPTLGTDGERSDQQKNIPNNIPLAATSLPPDEPPDPPPVDDGFVHRWVSVGGGTPNCATDGHGGRLTRDAAAVTCPGCVELGDPNEERPCELPPPAWVTAWLKPEQREAFQAVVLEGVHCRTAAWLADVSPNVISGRVNSARDTISRLLAWEAERAAEGIPLTEDDRRPPQRESRDRLLSIVSRPAEDQPCSQSVTPSEAPEEVPSAPVESDREEPAPIANRKRRMPIPKEARQEPPEADDSATEDDEPAEALAEQEEVVVEPTERISEPTWASKPANDHASGPLGAYLRDVARYPVLSREEERDVATRYRQTGDPKLLNRLVTANLRYVVSVAMKWKGNHNLLDLIQEGNDGVIDAAKRFDPSTGNRFLTIASWYVKQRLTRCSLVNKRIVALKSTESNLFYRIRKSRAKLGPDADDARVAKDTGIREEKIRDIDQRFSGGDESLDAPVSPENTDSGARVDFTPAPDHYRPDVATETEERDAVLKQKLRAFGDGLSGRKLEIFNRRLLSEEPETLEQIAHRFYLTRERIRQIETQLKDELREYLLSEFEEESLGIQATG